MMSDISEEYVTNMISSLNSINSGATSDSSAIRTILEESYTLISNIKQQNRETMEKMKSIFHELKNNNDDNTDANNESIQNLNNLKNLYKTTQKQNENNMKSFLENYLYVIVKVLLMIVVFFLAYQFSSFSIPVIDVSNIKKNTFGDFSKKEPLPANKNKKVNNSNKPIPIRPSTNKNNSLNNSNILNNNNYNSRNIESFSGNSNSKIKNN